MKRHLLTVLLILSISSFFPFPLPSFAVDRGGCLTCHRYPGLVRLEKSREFKVLHIDEEKHLISPHGKVDCVNCHTLVVKVPHTDETRVECTTHCHLEDREKIEALDSSYYSTYHKDEKFAITRLDDKSSCRVCHPLYPHSKNNKVRALVNMHSGFMLCEVCHLKKEGLDNLTYQWKDPEVFEFTGEPYGTHQKQETREVPGTKKLITKMLKIFSPKEKDPGETQHAEYLISRIAVFTSKDGEQTLLMNTADNVKAKEFMEKETAMSAGEKKEELKYFHREIAKKEISVACNECHSPGGILDYRKLGFDEKRTKDLQYMNIKGLVTKYETFYFPHLFGH